MAERVLREAPDTQTGLVRARELASHYRWRAAVTNPDYSERSKVEVSGKVSLEALVAGSMQAIEASKAPVIEHESNDPSDGSHNPR